jgi:hypothetical protein
VSATNRGTIRNESDFYETPEQTINIFLDNFLIQEGNMLEPCAGQGAISKVITNRYPTNFLMQVELQPSNADYLSKYGHYIDICNFLNWYPDNEEVTEFNTIITNPPFSIAQEIIEHCFEISHKDTDIIMLLRLGFLESKKRRQFWKDYPLAQLYPLISRPSFTGKGTDATAYGWFVWSNYRDKVIKPI